MSFLLRGLLAIVVIILLEFYFLKKVRKNLFNIFPNINPVLYKKVLTVILVLINIYPVILVGGWMYQYFTQVKLFEHPDSIWFDYLLMYPFWLWILIIIQTSILFILIDLTKLIIKLFNKSYNEKWRLRESKVILITALAIIIYLPARVIYDYQTVLIREVSYYKKNLPADLENFKLVLISDIQADRFTDDARLAKYINKVNSIKPDLVLIAGDMITSTPNYIDISAKYIGKIKANYGVYACVGDHDNWAYREDTRRSIREITYALEKKNVRMIDNGKAAINVGKAKVGITFITNTYVEKISLPVLDSLTNGKQKYDMKILLTHQPRSYLVAKASEEEYDLFLAGHTHGGQITFFFPFFNLSPTLFETKYVRGDFWIGSTLMIVTRGLGMSLVPLRYNSTPEITLINLKAK